MNSRVFQSNHPLLNHKLSIIRDSSTGAALFRTTIHEITTILLVEATSDLKLEKIETQTPLTTTQTDTLAERIGIVPILRAGLGMSDPILRIIPEASVWHLGFYRNEETLKPVEYYNKLPKEAKVDVALIVDPMLATGGSAIAAIDTIKQWGVKNIKFLSIISAPEGIEKVNSAHPDVSIYTAQIDEKLTKDHEVWPDGYIWPGLGDAGDRIHGT